jgi:hypothetical protein
LKLELKKCKDMLGSRKAQASGKRLVLKGKIVITIGEILKAMQEAEEATWQKKQNKTGRTRGRPRKNAQAVIVSLEKSGDEEDGSEDGPDA